MLQLSDNELQVMNVIWQNGIVTANQIKTNGDGDSLENNFFIFFN